MPKMMPGSKPSKLAGLSPVDGEAYQRMARESKRLGKAKSAEDQIRDLIVERAGRRWGAPSAEMQNTMLTYHSTRAPAGWMKEINGPGWMGPNGEYWDGMGTPPWGGRGSAGKRPSHNVDGDTLFYPHGGGPPTTTPPYGAGFSFSPRG